MKNDVIKVKPFLRFLEGVYLGGILNECLIEVKKGKARVEAIDITNSIIVAGTKKILSGNINAQFGIGNVELLIKFFSSVQDESLSFKQKGNYLLFTVRGKSSHKKLEYLLTQNDLIATRLDLLKDKKKDNTKHKNPIGQIANSLEYSVELSASFIKDHCSYMGMSSSKNQVKNEFITISFDEDGQIEFIYGEKNDHMLRLGLDSEIDEGDDFEIKVNGEHLSKIFMAIEYSQEDPPTISFSEKKPIVIQSGNMGWAIVPIIDSSEE